VDPALVERLKGVTGLSSAFSDELDPHGYLVSPACPYRGLIPWVSAPRPNRTVERTPRSSGERTVACGGSPWNGRATRRAVRRAMGPFGRPAAHGQVRDPLARPAVHGPG